MESSKEIDLVGAQYVVPLPVPPTSAGRNPEKAALGRGWRADPFFGLCFFLQEGSPDPERESDVRVPSIDPTRSSHNRRPSPDGFLPLCVRCASFFLDSTPSSVSLGRRMTRYGRRPIR